MSNRDHPRVGGEKLTSLSNRGTLLGSPPRGRGKDSAKRLPPRQWRITPAWAGKSLLSCCHFPDTWDHPRVGGEKVRDTKAGSHAQGSPPRGRGKAAKPLPCSGCAGITPAWAGKSDYAAFAFYAVQDHPRVGGEKKTGAVNSGFGLGSPPRGRGKVCYSR